MMDLEYDQAGAIQGHTKSAYSRINISKFVPRLGVYFRTGYFFPFVDTYADCNARIALNEDAKLIGEIQLTSSSNTELR